jgi:hypothetical protein
MYSRTRPAHQRVDPSPSALRVPVDLPVVVASLAGLHRRLGRLVDSDRASGKLRWGAGDDVASGAYTVMGGGRAEKISKGQRGELRSSQEGEGGGEKGGRPYAVTIWSEGL